MGCSCKAKCLDCRAEFRVDDGGGMTFHLVRCDKCGRTKTIPFDDIKKLDALYSSQQISEEEYNLGIGTFAGKCRCKGQFKVDAPPRCPKCRSTNIHQEESDIMYD